MKLWTRKARKGLGMIEKEGKKNERENGARIVSYFETKEGLYLANEFRISKRISVTDPPISRVPVESQIQTPIHSRVNYARTDS